ncbi:hypothetical protein [Coprobacter sp.]
MQGLFYAVLSVLISMLFQFSGMELEIVALTASFVLSLWFVLGIQKLVFGKGGGKVSC